MTDTYELPPLGRTPHNVTIFGPGGHTRVSAFLAADVEAYARLAVKAERERAIAVVQAEIDRAEALMAVEENGAPVFDREQTDAGICALRIVAAAIRAG